MNGSYKVKFRSLEAYTTILRSSNPKITSHFGLYKDYLQTERRSFKRIFICFDSLRKGWLVGCIPIIVLDVALAMGQFGPKTGPE